MTPRRLAVFAFSADTFCATATTALAANGRHHVAYEDRSRMGEHSSSPQCDGHTLLSDGRARKAFQARLLDWFDTHGRDLPWRKSRDPYTVWISEVMLQQTTVTAVQPYFARFIARFPTVHALAAGELNEVLRLWEGLGYYSRGRNLHAAAQEIVSNRRGEFPNTVATLQELPGIGRYTAGAIASFAFNTAGPIVEANTQRLYARLLGLIVDPRSKQGLIELWNFAEQILIDNDSPGSLNSAMMDLGNAVCKPDEPDCKACPVSRYCTAFQQGIQRTIPVRTPRVEPTQTHEASVAVFNAEPSARSRCLMLQYPEGERWAGLWDFVRVPLSQEPPPGNRGDQQIVAAVAENSGLTIEQLQRLSVLKHSVTRYRITLQCCMATLVSGELTRPVANQKWLPVTALDTLPLSVTGRKFATQLVDEI